MQRSLRSVACILLAAASVASAATPAERADAAIAKGLEFLQKSQSPDGSWGKPTDPPAISALALRAFALDGQARKDFVQRGYQQLLRNQMADGGIYRDMLGNYNTAIAVTALAAANNPEYQPAIDKAVAYLKGLQFRPDAAAKPTDAATTQPGATAVDKSDNFYGGWGYGGQARGPARPDLSNAQMALDALHDAKVPANDPAMERAVVFLSRLQNNSETNDQSWAGDDGGFIYGANGDHKGSSVAGEFTDASGARRLRSYGSMTYAGLKSMIYAGLSKDDPRVKAAVKWVTTNWTLDENPGLRASGPDNAKNGLFYYYHTMARALDAYGEPTLKLPDGRVVDWRSELIEKLASVQKEDGSWTGEKRWMEGDPTLVTAYCVAALIEARDDLKEHPATDK